MNQNIVEDALVELQPVIAYIKEIHKQKENVAVVKDFLESRINKEKSSETKVVLKIASKQLDRSIAEFENIEKTLYDDFKEAAMKYATVVISECTKELEGYVKK